MKEKKDFRFADQIKAAAGSIMDNIAEGFERSSRLEFLNSLSIAKGESGEIRSQLYRAFDDGYIHDDEFKNLYAQVYQLAQKIGAFIKYLNRTTTKGLKFKNRSIL